MPDNEPCQKTLQSVLELLQAKGLHEACIVIRDTFKEAFCDVPRKNIKGGTAEDGNVSLSSVRNLTQEKVCQPILYKVCAVCSAISVSLNHQICSLLVSLKCRVA